MNDQDQTNDTDTTHEEQDVAAPMMPDDDEPRDTMRPDIVALLSRIAESEPSRAADLFQSLLGYTGAQDRVVTPAGSRAYRYSDHSTPLLDDALAKAQGQIRNAVPNRTNTHLKTSYADLAAVWDACRAACSDAGIAIKQPVWTRKGHLVVTTRLSHHGQWVEADLPVQADSGQKGVNNKQAVGIAITYAKRYALTSMLGIPSGEDTDGEDGSERSEREEPVQNAQSRWRALVNQFGQQNVTPKQMLSRVGKTNPGELTNSSLTALERWLAELQNSGA